MNRFCNYFALIVSVQRTTVKQFCRNYSKRFAMGEDIAVTKFREYIRIDTEQPNPDYEKCFTFFQAYATELGLQVSRFFPKQDQPKRPVIILTLPGQNPKLKTQGLYSHLDVVPTFKDKWTYPPYEAHKDETGRIYGRGTQDMKSVGIQYLEAYRRLRKAGTVNFLRTIHFIFGADEEIGGPIMERFVKTQDFVDLNLGFVLDEGLASETDAYKVFYGERCPWWVKVTIPGTPGHGSRFMENDAGTKLQRLLEVVYKYRSEQKAKVDSSGGKLKLGDLTSVNLTKVDGGVQVNVLPDEIVACFDIRVIPSEVEGFEDVLKQWMTYAGAGVKYSFEIYTFNKNTTPITDDDPHWHVFSSTLKSEGCRYETEIFSGATDSRFLRMAGYKSIGFSPMNNSPVLLHCDDEYLDEKVFLRGVQIYEKLIPNLANIPEGPKTP